jgi:hypothetical protein
MNELSRTCRDLAEIAFAIFRARIDALGLGEWKPRSLYAGFTPFALYQAAAASPSLQDLKCLWLLDSGKEQRLFVDQNPHAMAFNFISWTGRNAELSKLLKQAQAEFKKAQSAITA